MTASTDTRSDNELERQLRLLGLFTKVEQARARTYEVTSAKETAHSVLADDAPIPEESDYLRLVLRLRGSLMQLSAPLQNECPKGVLPERHQQALLSAQQCLNEDMPDSSQQLRVLLVRLAKATQELANLLEEPAAPAPADTGKQTMSQMIGLDPTRVCHRTTTALTWENQPPQDLEEIREVTLALHRYLAMLLPYVAARAALLERGSHKAGQCRAAVERARHRSALAFQPVPTLAGLRARLIAASVDELARQVGLYAEGALT